MNMNFHRQNLYVLSLETTRRQMTSRYIEVRVSQFTTLVTTLPNKITRHTNFERQGLNFSGTVCTTFDFINKVRVSTENCIPLNNVIVE